MTSSAPIDVQSSTTSSPHNSEMLELAECKVMEMEKQPGYLTAYVQVLASFMLFFNAWGIGNAFGVFQTYYSATLLRDESDSNISWIGSIQIFLLLLGGIWSGPLYDAGHVRPLVSTGGFLVVFGMMMTSLGKTYTQIILAQGVTVGLGMGCLVAPALALIPPYFPNRAALGLGIATCGGSIGAVVYSIVFHSLINSIGFPWTVRTMAFISLTTLLVAILTIHPLRLPSTRRPLFDIAILRSLSYDLFSLGTFFSFMGLYVPFFYIQTWGTSIHISATLSFYLLVVMNAASTFGRIIPNLLADRVGPINVIVPFIAVCTLLGYVWIAIKSTASALVFSVLYGFFSGTFVSLVGPCIASLSTDKALLGTHVGMTLAFSSFGLLIGSPIAGVLLNGGWLGPEAFCGSANVAALILLAAARMNKAEWRWRAKV